MNLFGGGKTAKPATPPSIDDAAERVRAMRRGAGLQSRAASMLVKGNEAPTVAKREVTGN
jgi:hypothetical protein